MGSFSFPFKLKFTLIYVRAPNIFCRTVIQSKNHYATITVQQKVNDVIQGFVSLMGITTSWQPLFQWLSTQISIRDDIDFLYFISMHKVNAYGQN